MVSTVMYRIVNSMYSMLATNIISCVNCTSLKMKYILFTYFYWLKKSD